MTRIASDRGYEVWSKFSRDAGIYELFASADGNDYIGCADTRAEARRIAHNWIAERVAE